MNRRLADRLAGLGLLGLLAVGLYGTWQAYRQTQAVDGMMGSMMRGSMGGMGTTNALWYALATVVVVVVVGGVYVAVREDLTDAPNGSDTAARGPAPASSAPTERKPSETASGAPVASQAAGRRLLDLLPDDERRVLEPVLRSPGLTQIELRDRSDFSKSKVSQTVSDLEKRGLLYRERQGRTFRVYPDESLDEN